MKTRKVLLGLACFSCSTNFLNKVLLTYLDYLPDGQSAEFYVSAKVSSSNKISNSLNHGALLEQQFLSPRDKEPLPLKILNPIISLS